MENQQQRGTLYGVSVGPGDPELLTVKAVRVIGACPVIAAPQTPAGGTLALDIAKGAVELSGKTILPLRFAMSRDKAKRDAAYAAAAAALREHLDAGQDVAMLNLGDVSVYATFGWVQAVLEPLGYRTVMVPGVPSFCAAAAALGRPLTGGMDQPLTVAPGSIDLDELLRRPGAKVLMKNGRALPAALDALRGAGLLDKAALCINVGLPGERLVTDLEHFDPEHGDAGYFATVLIGS